MRSQAIRVHEHGGPEVMKIEEVEVREPGPGEVRVRNRAVGVNFIDTYHRTGLYPLDLPHGIGTEAAGEVDAVGEGVSNLSVGDRVVYLSSSGPHTYAQHGFAAAERAIPLPDGISEETAAACLLKGMTVEYLVQRTFPVRAGQTVLFHAAAGGVGLIACQWLKAIGATIIGTVSTDEKAELARAHGCTHTIVYTREDVVERVKALTDGAGVPVVYDSVGKSTMAQSLDCLAPRGMFVSFGNASGAPDPLELLTLSQKGSLFATRPTLFTYVKSREELMASSGALFERILAKDVKIEVNQRWPLAEAAEAHRALESRGTTGATVLIP